MNRMKQELLLSRGTASGEAFEPWAWEPVHTRLSLASVTGRKPVQQLAMAYRVPEEESRDLVGFPFAISAFLFGLSGMITMACGVTGDGVWLTGLGFLVAFAGAGMYGWSLQWERR